MADGHIAVLGSRSEALILFWVQLYRSFSLHGNIHAFMKKRPPQLPPNASSRDNMKYLWDREVFERMPNFIRKFGERIHLFYTQTCFAYVLYLPPFFDVGLYYSMYFSLNMIGVLESVRYVQLATAEKAGDDRVLIGPVKEEGDDSMFDCMAAARKLLPATRHLSLMKHFEVKNAVIDLAITICDQVSPSSEEGATYLEIFRQHNLQNEESSEPHCKRQKTEHEAECSGPPIKKDKEEELKDMYVKWLNRQRDGKISHLLMPVAAQWHGGKIWKALDHATKDCYHEGDLPWRLYTPAVGYEDDEDANTIFLVSNHVNRYFAVVKGFKA